MTEQQEVILDALMAAEDFGDHYWAPGPLDFVARALRAAGLTHHKDPPSALGYPLPLCVAVEGASWTVKEIDERRALAITLFTEVPPRPAPYELGPPTHVEAAVWSAGQAAIFCDPDSRHANAALALIQPSAARVPAAMVWEVSAALERAISDYNGVRAEFVQPRLALSVVFFALHAWRRLRESPADAVRPACFAVRDTARLAGLTKGAAGAVTFCIDLARRLGM